MPASSHWFSLGLAVILNATANILIKAGASGVPSDVDLGTLWRIALSPYIVAGVASFAAALAFYAMALTQVDLSVGYPIMTVLGIAIVFLWSALFFHEDLSWSKITGTVLALAGVVLLAQGG